MVNNVTLVGRITRDPELKSSASGTSICNFTLAVNRNFKNQNGDYDADFIPCVVFGPMAQTMERYVTKGNLLAVTGRMQVRNYENNMGQRVYVTEVIANNVSFLESKNRSQNNDYNAPSPYDNMPESQSGFSASDVNSFDDIDDDDLPF